MKTITKEEYLRVMEKYEFRIHTEVLQVMIKEFGANSMEVKEMRSEIKFHRVKQFGEKCFVQIYPDGGVPKKGNIKSVYCEIANDSDPQRHSHSPHGYLDVYLHCENVESFQDSVAALVACLNRMFEDGKR